MAVVSLPDESQVKDHPAPAGKRRFPTSWAVEGNERVLDDQWMV